VNSAGDRQAARSERAAVRDRVAWVASLLDELLLPPDDVNELHTTWISWSCTLAHGRLHDAEGHSDITVRDGYGQTETTAVIRNSPRQRVKPGSIGRPKRLLSS